MCVSGKYLFHFTNDSAKMISKDAILVKIANMYVLAHIMAMALYGNNNYGKYLLLLYFCIDTKA